MCRALNDIVQAPLVDSKPWREHFNAIVGLDWAAFEDEIETSANKEPNLNDFEFGSYNFPIKNKPWAGSAMGHVSLTMTAVQEQDTTS